MIFFEMFFKKTKDIMVKIFEKYQLIFMMIFIFIFIRISYKTLKEAINSSVDMQWYPSVQYWGRGISNAINPYIAYLNHDTFMSQGPNYMPMLYVLMYPFALMDFEGAKIAYGFLNILCFLGTLWLFFRSKISLAFLVLMSLFVLVGYTFENVMGNGQFALILGFFVVLAYKYRQNFFILTLCLSIVLIKYSFGIPILLGFFLARYYKEALLAGLINFLFFILFAFEFHTSILESLLLPLKVSQDATGIGPSDLMSLSRIVFGNHFLMATNPFVWMIGVIYGIYIFCILIFRPCLSLIVSSSILLSLGTFYHLGYDHYMFFIAILIAKNHLKSTHFSMIFLILLALFFWFGNRLKSFHLWEGDYFWAMNMGVVFCSVMSAIIIITAFAILLGQKFKKQAIQQKD
ncbi:glycosyltransferase family 87 protein [Helicobacter sp. 11S03491-1]|uniref:glycosyltransferase family 87 protein n=1 Tax=Helicobacter sp. 11S03491-1 TaxID=1476196 RepID=UPI000BA6AD5B|nr:glycosyltransferase family 87 protein [Helicobacter sp. 11S03491-1]PAF43458.1 hypothetical protein BKH45_02190 [Helicobacter sp. 11S03491-1]